MSEKKKQICSLLLLCTRLWFLFIEAVDFSTSDKNLLKKNPVQLVENTIVGTEKTHWVSDVIIQDYPQINDEKTGKTIESWEMNGEKEIEKKENTVNKNIESTKIVEKSELEDVDLKKISLNDLSANIYNKQEILDNLYKKTKDEKVLKVLINDLLANYQFDVVKNYLTNINIFQSTAIDKQSYIYTYINTLSVTDPNSMTKFVEFIEQLKWQNLLWNDEYLFYKWLAKVRDWNYDAAIETFSQMINQDYSQFIPQLKETIINYNNQKWMPSYYKDALVALISMKNWYFSIANKLAIDTVLKDDDYILPYQILAYSNFLTKNREKAISYLYDLWSLDIENKDKYDFYMWISYYWFWDYEKSIMTLLQISDKSTYKWDIYRYLLLDYEKLGQTEKMVQIRQKLLWEDSLMESDFKYFFDYSFYKPFSLWENSKVFMWYEQMSYDFISKCYDKFWYKNDTCIYWEVWLDIVNKSRTSVEENLLYLSQNYPSSSIYQALGDYYKSINEKEKSKEYYIKAISLSENSTQKSLMEDYIMNLMD